MRKATTHTRPSLNWTGTSDCAPGHTGRATEDRVRSDFDRKAAFSSWEGEGEPVQETVFLGRKPGETNTHRTQ